MILEISSRGGTKTRRTQGKRVFIFPLRSLRLGVFARGILIVCFLFSLLLPLCAFDFGLIFDQNADYGGLESDGSFTYSASLIPRLYFLFGEENDLYISAGIEAAYGDEWTFVPELLRTELSLNFNNLELRAGRMYHSDPLGFIANGLFDGAKVSFDSEAGSFSAGAWYTGLLYKRRANITMSEKDRESYAIALDFEDFTNTYFAPRRFVAALGWEHFGWPFKPKFSLLGQADLSGDNPLHSQYVVGKITLPVKVVVFDLGACLELLQDDGKFGTAYAAEARIAWMPPVSISQRLSLLARYASGGEFAFLPLTTQSQGNILDAKLPGVSMISLDYIARLNSAISAGLKSSCFVRSDLETYNAYPLAAVDSGNYFLGNEFFARLLWAPVSDLQFNLGAGVFLPSLGDVAPNASISWQVKLNIVFSLY